MPNRITSFLISHGETHQLDALARADRAANAVERLTASARVRIAKILEEATGWMEVYHRSRVIMHRLPDQIRGRLDMCFREMVHWSHRRTAKTLKKTLPVDYLKAAAKHKIERASHDARRKRFSESGATTHRHVCSDRRFADHEFLREDTITPATGSLLDLALTALGLKPTDYANPLREPARSELTVDQQRDIFVKLLFAAPAEQWVQRILQTTLSHQTWYQALDSNVRKAEFGPERLANQVATSYSLGRSQKEITAEIKPYFDGLGWRAARMARTFGLAIAGQTQQEMHSQLGDLEIGKMVRATLDERTRPAHRLRNGTVYYREPKQGELGYDQMPNPPLEADGSLAWN